MVRKSTALIAAICGTLVLLLLFFGGRMLFIQHHTESFDKLIAEDARTALVLRENGVDLRTLNTPEQTAPVLTLLGGYTYTEYPHFLRPDSDELRGNRLTVVFTDGDSIGVDADGYVLINGKVRDVQNSEGKALYQELYRIFYPNAV